MSTHRFFVFILTLIFCYPLYAFAFGPTKGQRVFTGQALQEIVFPLGGIGTGSIGLGGRGDLRDWEIFNRPAKGSKLDFSFFALWAQRPGKPSVARILERRFLPPYRGGGFGLAQRQLSGLPRFDEVEFSGEYPFANVTFRDRAVPVQVELQAWNPYIPLNVDDSALPAAILQWKVSNSNRDTMDVAIAACLTNPIGSRYTDIKGKQPGLGKNKNVFIDTTGYRGILLSSEKVAAGDPNFGTMAMLTPVPTIQVQTHWYRGGWWDPCHIFWDDFSDDGRVKEVREASVSDTTSTDVCCIVLRGRIPPGASITMPVVISWYFPNRENYWNGEEEVRGKIMQNYVTGRFRDAWDAGGYVVRNLPRLESETRSFHDALFSSTFPPAVLDAISSQMSILKTTVGMLLQDGNFYGFEGVGDQSGCCPLNCTHVWNYEQSLAYLFPQLERSMRETDFLHNTLPGGYMTFRTLIPAGSYWWKFKPCADGQMGEIVRMYREWKLSGDTPWLRKLWPHIKEALEFAWIGPDTTRGPGMGWTKEQIPMAWDVDKDGVMEAEQHNTYDIEFYGPNTMTGSLYLAALKAGALMADAIGENESAQTYRSLFALGSARYDSLLWNGEYYRQKVEVVPGIKVPPQLVSPDQDSCEADCACKETKHTSALPPGAQRPKYQYDSGCLADQLLGQYLAHVAGLGYVLDSAHVRTALASIMRNNFRTSLESFANVQRVYAVNDDEGLVLCTWPHGDRPALPFPYSDEVWTGIEYQVAASLMFNGMQREGFAIAKAVRDRYDGRKRNPWDEEECGHHYARAMSSWAMLLALSGFSYDGVNGEMGFHPQLDGKPFSSFWSCGTGWGTITIAPQRGTTRAELRVLYGTVNPGTLHLPGKPIRKGGVRLSVNGLRQLCTAEVGARVTLKCNKPISLRKGDAVTVLY